MSGAYSRPSETAPTPGPTDTPLPIELDLSGSGIGITQLTSSNTFETIDQDGYQHRTAWATAGDAVLFIDPNGLNTIRDADQYIFTDWDPSAKSDMEALRNVFDTNHDGKLDAGDAAFAEFSAFADGSSIDGETSFTRADGSTGTVAAVTYAADAQGYAVRSTTTVNADGSTTVDNRALNADGSLDNDTASTTSADGTTRTIAYDDAGNGVVDRTQTIVDTTNPGGSRTETVSDRDGQGQLVDSTATTTAPDGSVFIRRDTTGGGITTQTETRKTLPSLDTGDTLADISADGTVIDSTFTQIGQDGLGRDVQVDHTGTGNDDHSTVTRTTGGTSSGSGGGTHPHGSGSRTLRAFRSRIRRERSLRRDRASGHGNPPLRTVVSPRPRARPGNRSKFHVVE